MGGVIDNVKLGVRGKGGGGTVNTRSARQPLGENENQQKRICQNTFIRK